MIKLENPLVLTFHHVCITASDYQSAIAFYVNILGLEIYRESFSENRNAQKLELYSDGSYVIELFAGGIDTEYDPDRAKDTKTGLDHLSFLTDDVIKTLEYLRERGVPVTEVKKDRATGRKYGFCWDPDGTKIEFYEREGKRNGRLEKSLFKAPERK